MKLVAACLCGLKCRYDGTSKIDREILDMVARGGAVPVCPEQLGSLPTPREACEQQGDKVVSASGKEYTAFFNKGAAETLRLAQAVGATEFIGRAKSPSCGAERVFDGTFGNNLMSGNGVTALLLQKNGIKVSDR